MLHLGKGEIVDFAHDEEVEMNYIETSNVLEIGELEQKAPRNWIPELNSEDADITEETREKFEEMCDPHPDAFSKNNKDIARTTLIEMEIDMGDSLPVAQNPYTLPLKHHEWVRKEIEKL